MITPLRDARLLSCSGYILACLSLTFSCLKPVAAQPPPLPEQFKPVSLTVRPLTYSPPPDRLNPENYQAYQQQAKQYLADRPWDEKRSRIYLDLWMTAVRTGNAAEAEKARVDLVIQCPTSLEANYLLEKTDGKKLAKEIIRKFRMDSGKLTIAEVKKYGSTLEILLNSDFSEIRTEELSALYKICAISKNLPIPNNDKEKKNAFIESEIEIKFLGELDSSKSTIKQSFEELWKYSQNPNINMVDYLLICGCSIKENWVCRGYLKFIYNNYLSKEERRRLSVAQCMAPVLMTESDFEATRELLEPVVDQSKKPQMRYLLGLAHVYAGQPEKGAAQFKKLKSEFPGCTWEKSVDKLIALCGSREKNKNDCLAFLDAFFQSTDPAKLQTILLEIESKELKSNMKGTIWIDLVREKLEMAARIGAGLEMFAWTGDGYCYFSRENSGVTQRMQYVPNFAPIVFGPTSEVSNDDFFGAIGLTVRSGLTLPKLIKSCFATGVLFDKIKRKNFIEKELSSNAFVNFQGKPDGSLLVEWIIPCYNSIDASEIIFCFDQNRILNEIQIPKYLSIRFAINDDKKHTLKMPINKYADLEFANFIEILSDAVKAFY